MTRNTRSFPSTTCLIRVSNDLTPLACRSMPTDARDDVLLQAPRHRRYRVANSAVGAHLPKAMSDVSQQTQLVDLEANVLRVEDVVPAPPSTEPPIDPHPRERWWNKLGPGLITGAADDDPSGIATYSQGGAQLATRSPGRCCSPFR